MEKDRSWSVCRSCAVGGGRTVVEREREIKAFVPEEFWEVDASTTTPSGEALALQVTHQNETVPSGQKEQTQASVRSTKNKLRLR
ncbi:DNA topoisomerase 1 [Escherichia coli]|nr:DNA topoisomerase 1 [Escherichia coli]